MKTICIVTGTRAEWGILSPLAKKIHEDPALHLQIIATNMHLSEAHGMTYREIEADGFTIDEMVPMPTGDGSRRDIVKGMGTAMMNFADAFAKLSPDLLILLGDRYELLPCASAALLFKIPIAHLHGGEITTGAMDDSIRHAITKLSHVHFTSTEAYRQRVIQLGETPERVFNVGALGVENVMETPTLSKEELESAIGFPLKSQSLLVTFHPATLDQESPLVQIEALLSALDDFPDYQILFTSPNSDPDGLAVARRIQDYVARHPGQTVLIPSLGRIRYFSALKSVSAVVGNSSSGIIEVPSFGIPTLDIGDRQSGRIRAASVIHCETTRDAIVHGLRECLSPAHRERARHTRNPYHRKGTAEAIVSILKTRDAPDILMKKFYSPVSPQQPVSERYPRSNYPTPQ